MPTVDEILDYVDELEIGYRGGNPSRNGSQCVLRAASRDFPVNRIRRDRDEEQVRAALDAGGDIEVCFRHRLNDYVGPAIWSPLTHLSTIGGTR